MNRIILLVLLILSLNCGRMEAVSIYPSFDRITHFTSSTILTVWSYSFFDQALESGKAGSRKGAVTFTISLGLGKEFYDLDRGGAWSLADLIYDIGGIGLGLVLINNFID